MLKLRDRRELVAKLRKSTDEALARQLDEFYRELFNLRMRHATRQLDNVREVTRVKKAIAVVKTVQRERAIARALEAEEA
ncbi:MAG: 50S ribosomal protein L29 [Dehalococcoidia bacterium]|nr:50S ribosomal protein L29 [Dehalococcoidia bacterium]